MKNCHQVGFGFDSHVFARSGKLKLGGIEIPSAPALRGHSDGDAVLHAVTDALLGASGLGDIGEFFPDADKKTKGVSSRVILQKIWKKVKNQNFNLVHLDVTILADQPKLTPHKNKMRRTIAECVPLAKSHINIKAKTQEGLCLFQKARGIAVWSVVTLKRI